MQKTTYEDLQLAHELISQDQQRSYWAEYPDPHRPIGRVFLEPIRQLCTFLVPLALIIAPAYYIGAKIIIVAFPIALLVGYLLDWNLSRSIRKKQNRECNRDRGRYHAVRILSTRLGLSPAEITLDMVEEMARDYKVVKAQRARQEQLRLATERQKAEARRSASHVNLRATSVARTGFSAATVAAVSHYSEIDEPSVQFWEPSYVAINPASGLPMMGGDSSGVDVGGNPFGSGF